jgi:hypothetical protein
MKEKMLLIALSAAIVVGGFGCESDLTYGSRNMQEIQLTFEPRNHDLDNNDDFSPDDKWLVYDTRWPIPKQPVSEIGANSNIEKVNVETGEVVIVYETEILTQSKNLELLIGGDTG